MNKTFGCAINCIDGRAQIPVIEWVKFHGGTEYVDMITEPGADGALAIQEEEKTAHIYRRLQTAVAAHNPGIVAVCGHFDCVGNPVSNEEHIENIMRSADLVAQWIPEIRVVGLFINEFGAVEPICDSSEGDPVIKSYL